MLSAHLLNNVLSAVAGHCAAVVSRTVFRLQEMLRLGLQRWHPELPRTRLEHQPGQYSDSTERPSESLELRRAGFMKRQRRLPEHCWLRHSAPLSGAGSWRGGCPAAG